MNDCSEKTECGGRRDFLVKAGVIAGGMVLSLSNVGKAQEKMDSKTATTATKSGDNEVVVKLGEKSPLNKVGGYQTVETADGKVVVVRVSDVEYKAFSAICPHKGGPIKYDDATKQLVCPWHSSRFDTNGKVVNGPAKTDLSAYAAENEVVVTLKPKS